MRILGLDYGSKTVGVAVSDPLGVTAQRLETIWRKQENKLRRTLAQVEETGKSYTPIELPDPKPEDEEAIVDTYHLNGVQATSYCRIRYTASLDMGRTERQRRVIQMIVDKAKKAGLSTIFDIMDQVFPMVKTSVSKTEILKMIPAMIGYSIDASSEHWIPVW